ncbi:MAG: tetratricopeptide repeat protein [Alphaproteobacteria bacterium]|jgi:tetratricopeptide (TPR) repeat protein|nr:tetratricopeptide repeat protein [Alphaproteobacteria bacterium]
MSQGGKRRLTKKERRRLQQDERASRGPEPSEDASIDEVLAGPMLVQEGLGALQQGRPQEALAMFRHVLDAMPDHPDALNLGGIAAFEAGETEEALDLLERAATGYPDEVDVHNNLGNVLKALGRLGEAEAAYRRTLAQNPDHPDGLYNLGITLEALGRPGEAEEVYRRAVEISPNFQAARFNLANSLKALGRLDEAEAVYRELLDAAPEHADGHNNLAGVLQETGRYDEAASQYGLALEHDPGHGEARYNLGTVLQEQDKLEEAVESYRRALEASPEHAGAMVNLGYALQKLARHGEAEAAYRLAVEAAPDYAGAATNLADLYLEVGDPAKALDACDSYLARHPGDTAAMAFKCVVLTELGEATAATDLLGLDDLVRPAMMAVPDGYADIAGFTTALAEHVLAHPTLVDSPLSHATRKGKHSGELLADPKGPIADLESVIRDRVEAYMAALPDRSEHPFIDRKPAGFGLSIWGVVMPAQGHQIAHIHPAAWLSGVCYPLVPDLIREDDQGHAGWIAFNRPPDHFHSKAAPDIRYHKPETGLMILFPSYLYHHTVPFEAEATRISIAFDILPEG